MTIKQLEIARLAMSDIELAQAAIVHDEQRVRRLVSNEQIDVDAALARILKSAPTNRRAIELLRLRM